MSERARLLAILGLAPTASLADAKTAYRQKARALHPDKPGGSAKAMAAVNAAWDRLQVLFANPQPDQGARPSSTHHHSAAQGQRTFTIDTPHAINSMNADTMRVIAGFFQERCAVLRKATLLERWLGVYVTVQPHDSLRVLQAHAVVRNPNGMWQYRFEQPLHEGANVIVYPTVVPLSEHAVLFSSVNLQKVRYERGASMGFVLHVQNLGIAHFAFHEGSTKAVHINTLDRAHLELIKSIEALAPHVTTFLRLIDGTAPLWLRPTLRRWMHARQAFAKACARLGSMTGISS